MSILDWFAKNKKSKASSEKLEIPGDLWVKCSQCSSVLFLKELQQNFKVCQTCQYHFRVSPEERLNYHFDEDSFEETDTDLMAKDFLGFSDNEPYLVKLKKAIKKTKRNDAIVIGYARLKGIPVNVAFMDFAFLGGSMGSVVGEKITRVIEKGVENRNPVIIFSASGGARMHEGILSLMQMAKTSAALSRLAEAKVPYISVLTDPTTGGTSASFSMLGDIHIAEPGALISFAGPRVIEQTIRQKLPKGFQRSEFLLDHGMVDMVVNRRELRRTLYQIIRVLGGVSS